MRVTVIITAVTVAFFAMQLAIPGSTQFFGLKPADVMQNNGYWQFITYLFIHDPTNPTHIGLNMLIFFIFGVSVESALKWKKYILLYFLSGIGSAMLYILLTGPSSIPLIGASGAVFGVMTAYGILFPKNIIMIFPGIPIPALAAIVFLAVEELFFGMLRLQPGIANFGHLGGIVTGLILMLYWKYVTKSFSKKFMKYEFFWDA